MLTEYFGDTWLHESIKPLLVTGFDTTNPRATAQEFHFSSVLAARNVHAENFRLRDIGRATSAATTFFPAASIEDYDGTPRRFADAGLTVNNPARDAYQQVKELFPRDRIVVFSFGTGAPRESQTIPADAGAARSVKRIISNMMEINSKKVHFSFNEPRSLAEGDGYVRVQCELPRDIDLDGVSAQDIHDLITAAETKRAEIGLIAEFLRAHRM